jgi:glycosyltransferase involved in cell wall biosynthesis
MRILCVMPYYAPAVSFGGPVQSVSALCEAMVRAGEAVTVFTTNANTPTKNDAALSGRTVRVEGVEVHYFPRLFPRGPLRFFSPALGDACRKRIRDFDLVYCMATFTYPFRPAAKAASAAGVPYVVSPRGSFMKRALEQKAFKKRLWLQFVERKLTNGAAAIHCTSDLEAEQTARCGFAPACFTIPNGCDLSPFTHLPSRGALRRRLGLTESQPLSLFVGRLHPEKGLDAAIAAFAEVVNLIPEAHLAIVGPDAGQGLALRQLAVRLGIQENVSFPGMLTGERLLEAYTDADLFVLLSWRENFGMAGIEAMAAGCPTLLSNNVGIARAVNESRAGVVVHPEADALSKEWARLLRSDSLAEMGLRARRMVFDNFAIDAVAARMIGEFRKILDLRVESGIRADQGVCPTSSPR